MPPKSPPLDNSPPNVTEAYDRTASPDPMGDNGRVRFENYALPHAVELGMVTWTKNAENMALIMSLFATVQIILVQILPSLGDDNSTSLWNTTRFFMYAGILFHIGGAISSVAVIQMATTLPLRGRHLSITNPNSFVARVFAKKCPIPAELLYEPAEMALLAEWGLKKRWKFVAYNMVACFLLGFVSASLSLILWIYSWETHWAAIGGAMIPALLLSGWTFWTVLGS